jgi:hypothetical protein
VNEEEWLTSTNPRVMLRVLEGRTTARKLRLFAVACCRRVWEGLRDERSRRAVEVAERFADGRAARGELLAAHDLAYSAVDDCLHYSPFSEDQAIAACGSASEDAEAAAWEAVNYAWDGDLAAAERQHTALLRDIFGPVPFRPPPPLVPSVLAWNDGCVEKLARSIYDGRRFDDMPILADALEEAGCGDLDILGHCRAPGPHARGCWPLDLILGLT